MIEGRSIPQSQSPYRSFKHSLRPSLLPAIKPHLEKLSDDNDNSSRKYNRQYFKIPTINAEKNDNTDKEILNKLKDTNDEPFEDEKPKELVGDNASRHFYTTYKRINRIEEQNQFKNISSMHHKILDSVQTSLISRTDKLKLLPCKMGLIKLKGERQVLSIQNQKFGDRYIEILSEGLRTVNVISDFNLNQNRIEENGASLILPVISKQARSIELLSNHIGRKGLDIMLNALSMQNCKLQVLNLEDNNLENSGIIDLCKALIKNSSVEKLNISRNRLSDFPVSGAIAQMIENNETIVELYLHWNFFRGDSASPIFKALKTNKNIRVLDFSYNLLGTNNHDIGTTLKEFLLENKTMIHLDLSVNQFKKDDCQMISDGLKQNHTIYGFHFGGNYGYVDCKGFLIMETDSMNFSRIHIEKRIQSTNVNSKAYAKSVRMEKLRDTCWICDGWQIATFEWIPNKSGSASEEPIFIHLDYEGYDAIFLGKPHNGIFSTHRMVPYGELNYFYTANQMQVVSQIDLQKTHTEKFRWKCQLIDQQVEVLMDETNYRLIQYVHPVINDYDPTFDVKPRTPDPIYIPPKNKKVKRIWSYPISIWAPKYKFETQETLRACFEKDWSCSKITKFVKKPDEQEQIKDLLWQNYRYIKETYKFYASINPNGDVFSISQNPMQEFINKCQLVDQKTLKLSDVDLKFIATCSASVNDWKGNFRNPERCIVRYQMMEFLVRLAEDKFLRFNQQMNIVQATQAMLDQCMPTMMLYDSHKWRMERYYIEQCDDVCKKYKWVYDYLYMQNSKKKVKPGQSAFMCLDELKDICGRANIYDENFVDRDVNIAFNLSMMTYVDELEKDSLFQMSWVEFLEAIARIAEKYSLPPIGKEQEQLNYEARFALPLYYKLEAFVIHLIKNCVDEETKKNQKLPTISMFDIVEQDD